MKCATHPEQEAAGYCRNCGKPLCAQCTHQVQGALYCENCLAGLVSQASTRDSNPALAAVLGFIPGLGAIYNGEYIKGLIHIAVFAGLIAILNNQSSDSLEAFFGIALACFYFYMPIEAYRTARMKQGGGQPVHGGPVVTSFAGPPAAPFAGQSSAPVAGPVAPQPSSSNPLAGAIVLIALGVLFLLTNMGWLDADWLGHYWPVILILIGVWLLWKKLREPVNRGNQQS